MNYMLNFITSNRHYKFFNHIQFLPSTFFGNGEQRFEYFRNRKRLLGFDQHRRSYSFRRLAEISKRVVLVSDFIFGFVVRFG